MATTTGRRDITKDDKITNGTDSDEMGSKRDTWTTWFNVDDPVTGGNNGDYETTYKIKNLQETNRICSKNYDITEAQCRIDNDPLSVFDKDTPRGPNSDIFARYCTTDGLICRNEDQILRPRCRNYNIRFRCHYTADGNNDGAFPQFDVRIYIILAVVPVLIFLARILWGYIFRRRRQQRRNQRRARRRLNASNGEDIDDDSSSTASGLANPPPSYQDIFGKTAHLGTRSSVFAISRENIPICSKCESECCSVALIIGKQRNLENSEEIERTRHHDGDAASAELDYQNETEFTNETLGGSATEISTQVTSALPATPTHGEISSLPAARTNKEISSLPAARTYEETSSLPAAPTHEETSSLPAAPTHEETSSLPEAQTYEEASSLPAAQTYEEASSLPAAPTYEETSSLSATPTNEEITINIVTEEVDTNVTEVSVTITSVSEDTTVEVCIAQDTIEDSHPAPTTEETHPLHAAEEAHPLHTTVEEHIVIETEEAHPVHNTETHLVEDTAVTHPVGDTDNMHSDNSSHNSTGGDASEDVDSSSTNMEQLDMTLSLNPSLLHTLDISQPCACVCHRTIPSKQPNTAGYDNHGYAIDGDGVEENMQHPFPGMHVPVFGIHRVWSELSVSSSVTQTELPSYDSAVELMTKKTEVVSKTTTN